MVASGFLTKLAENNFEEQETNCSFKNGKKIVDTSFNNHLSRGSEEQYNDSKLQI